jgi:methionine--tRNA ligase beta chain
MKPERAARDTGVAPASVGKSSGATVSSDVQNGETGAESEKPEGKGGAKKERVEIDFSKVKVEPLFEEEVDFDTFSKSDFRVVKIKSCEEVKKSDKLLKFVLNDGSGEDRVILSGIKMYYDPAELVGKTAIAITNLPPRKMMGEYSNGMLISAVNEYDGEEMLNLLLVNDRIPAGAKLY